MNFIKYLFICICICLSVSTSCFAETYSPNINFYDTDSNKDIEIFPSTLNVNDAKKEEYIMKHGHSQEIVRMMELQQARLEPGDGKVKKNNRFVKFFKNLFYEKDLTMPLNDFGHNKITTPEASRR